MSERERLMNFSGRALWDHGIQAVKSGKATIRQFQDLCALWLRHRGLVYTSLGWWTPQELAAMGAVQVYGGQWALLAEERRHVVGRGGEQAVEIYHIASQANSFFGGWRKRNIPVGERSSNKPDGDILAVFREVLEL